MASDWSGYREILNKSPLFDGADEKALDHILSCMEARVRFFEKGETIYHYGEAISWAGIVLTGKVALIMPGKDGEESCIRIAGPAEAFGCAQSCLMEKPALVKIESGLKLLHRKLNFMEQKSSARIVHIFIILLKGSYVSSSAERQGWCICQSISGISLTWVSLAGQT